MDQILVKMEFKGSFFYFNLMPNVVFMTFDIDFHMENMFLNSSVS